MTDDEAMRLLDRVMGGDEEERSPAVRSLHAAMRRAADHPSAEAYAAFFALLAESHLWTVTAGQQPSLERLAAQARLSGHAAMDFRAGRTADGKAYLPATTTRQRLAGLGIGQPGDEMIRASFRFLASAALYGGSDTLIVNPGTVPFASIVGPLLATFADGGIPDSAAPTRLARIKPDALGPLESFELDVLPTGLLEALTSATKAESQITAASLVVRSHGSGRIFVVLALASGHLDRQALNDRLAKQVVDLIGGANYFTVEYVAEDDPRLSDHGRAVVLISG